MKATLIIPARDEAACIAQVITEVREHFAGDIIVVDNGSRDGTAEGSLAAGARVVNEPVAGYGRACATGVAAADASTDVLLFMDGDGSDRPEDIPALLRAIGNGADVALAVRRGSAVERGSIAPVARFGNWFTGILLGLFWGRRIHDLSPLKAIRASTYHALSPHDATYGWTVELLARAASAHANIAEVDAGYRQRRGGESKVSGQLLPSIRAGWRILVKVLSVAVATASSAAKGAWIGGVVALLAVAAIAVALRTSEPSSNAALWAAWILAWPLTLVGAGLGAAVASLATRRSRNVSIHPTLDR